MKTLKSSEVLVILASNSVAAFGLRCTDSSAISQQTVLGDLRSQCPICQHSCAKRIGRCKDRIDLP